MITSTVFRQVNTYKNTWMHPRSKQWHLNRLCHHPPERQQACSFHQSAKLKHSHHTSPPQASHWRSWREMDKIQRSSHWISQGSSHAQEKTPSRLVWRKQWSHPKTVDREESCLHQLAEPPQQRRSSWQIQRAPSHSTTRTSCNARCLAGRESREIQRYADTQRTKQLYDAIRTIYGLWRKRLSSPAFCRWLHHHLTKKVSMQDGKNIPASTSTSHPKLIKHHYTKSLTSQSKKISTSRPVKKKCGPQ